MRSSSFVTAFLAAVFLTACPRQPSTNDAAGDDAGVDGSSDVDAGYDPSAGNGFTGDILFDDGRVNAIDPSTLRAGSTQCRAPIRARVTRIVDGDTMHVEGLSETLPDADIRFIGVNAPEISHSGEPDQCYGPEATTFTQQLRGHLVWLTFDVDCTDPYDRLLAYVHIGSGAGDMWQRQLVRRGYARAAEFPPNSTYATLLSSDQSAADAADAGLWSACR